MILYFRISNIFFLSIRELRQQTSGSPKKFRAHKPNSLDVLICSTNALVLFLFLRYACEIHHLVQCKRFLPVEKDKPAWKVKGLCVQEYNIDHAPIIFSEKSKGNSFANRNCELKNEWSFGIFFYS